MKEVEILKTLKAEYKAATGTEYDANKKPAAGAVPAAPAQAAGGASGDLAIWEKVAAQGNKIRDLKSKKAAKVWVILMGSDWRSCLVPKIEFETVTRASITQDYCDIETIVPESEVRRDHIYDFEILFLVLHLLQQLPLK